ncbi:hypothetical protein GCM10023144_30640 [Pigmentiphaga soli]|uniref:BD-FAE-like domain-containing protein n=1 Tax=Pigmentiphaga soli TaxID=1007095 RepID=A0ABP8H9S8_9BURK
MCGFDFDTEDIEFRQVAGQRLSGRLYRPRGAGETPLLVDVHGGAWINGDRLTNASIHEALARDGIAVFAIDFRLPPVARYPDTVADVNAGLRWALRHARDLGSRRELVGGLGTSSGGHLMALNLLRPNDPLYAEEPGTGGLFDYVILCWPIVDPLARYKMVTAKGIDRLVDAHHQFWPSVADMEKGNPQLIVERGEFERPLPNALLIQGTQDGNVDHYRADMFGAAYRAAGGRAEVLKYEGEPHVFMTAKPDAPATLDALEHMKRFVREQTAGR